MNLFNKNKFVAFLLIFILLIPFFISAVSPVIYAGDSGGLLSQNYNWLRGLIMLLLSAVINNFANDSDTATPSPDNELIIEDIGQHDNQNTINSQKREVLGFTVHWFTPETSSYEALKNNWQNIDMTAPFWYTVNPDGSLEERFGGHRYEEASFAKNRDIKVLPLINNNQQNNMILVDSEVRNKAVNNIVDLVEQYDYDGVNIDFEFIPPWTRSGYTAFIKNLSQKLRQNDRMMTISVFPKIDVPYDMQGAYDYAALEPLVDRMVIMTYDHHWSTGPAGPIAPITWVEKNIEYTLEYLPPEKILLGIANYGYDWSNGHGQDLSEKKALQIASEHNANIKWNDSSNTPYYKYTDNKGVHHEVHFESSSSNSYKFDLVNKYDLRGVGIWRLGNSTSKFWDIIEEKLR